MVVSGVLFVLFDIIAVAFILSVVVRLTVVPRSRRARTWPSTSRSLRSRVLPSHTYNPWHPDGMAAEVARVRHPAGRERNTPAGGFACPKGPDDDPEFLHALGQRIREMRGESTD